MKTLLLLCALCVSQTGCVYTSVTTKDQARLTRISVFGNQQVGTVDLNKGTMTGYASQQAEAAAAVAEGVARGITRLK